MFYQILQDYADWSSQVIRAAFYPEKILRNTIRPPASLRAKLEDLSQSKQISQGVIDEFISHQSDLHKHVEKMLSSPERPPIEEFDMFLQLYEDFNERLSRFDVDSMLSDFGLDSSTGLRSANVIIQDLERELERRARRGHAFSIVVCQVDRPNADRLPQDLKIAAKAAKICMRSFDDAYLSGRNEILFSLKQTDNAGALRFVERLKESLQKEGAEFTMSFCAAEPMPGDDLNSLIANVRADLKEMAAQGAGEAGEYEEISPLQRFVKSITPSKK